MQICLASETTHVGQVKVHTAEAASVQASIAWKLISTTQIHMIDGITVGTCLAHSERRVHTPQQLQVVEAGAGEHGAEKLEQLLLRIRRRCPTRDLQPAPPITPTLNSKQ